MRRRGRVLGFGVKVLRIGILVVDTILFTTRDAKLHLLTMGAHRGGYRGLPMHSTSGEVRVGGEMDQSMGEKYEHINKYEHVVLRLDGNDQTIYLSHIFLLESVGQNSLDGIQIDSTRMLHPKKKAHTKIRIRSEFK